MAPTPHRPFHGRIAHLSKGKRTLQCGISTLLTAGLGHEQPNQPRHCRVCLCSLNRLHSAGHIGSEKRGQGLGTHRVCSPLRRIPELQHFIEPIARKRRKPSSDNHLRGACPRALSSMPRPRRARLLTRRAAANGMTCRCCESSIHPRARVGGVQSWGANAVAKGFRGALGACALQ